MQNTWQRGFPAGRYYAKYLPLVGAGRDPYNEIDIGAATLCEQGGSALKSENAYTPVREFKAGEIREIRIGLGMTQVTFALFMGVSKKTVEAWEAGRNMPDGPARRLLTMAQENPEITRKFRIKTT